jgi:hypothetical protein
MSGDASTPRPYPEWASSEWDRAEDAAYMFGFHLMRHCRDEALATVPKDVAPELRTAVETAVDTALHNVCDLLEGFWNTKAGPSNGVRYALVVNVTNAEGSIIESIPISPCMLDLPIGYWKWQGGEFR